MHKKRAGWLDHYSYNESVEILKELALVHASQAGPFTQDLLHLISSGDWDGLLGYRLDYTTDCDASAFLHARQALAFFEKFEPLKLKEIGSKTLAAFHSFGKSELSCKRVNDRFSRYKLGTPMGYPYDVILTDAREIIARILGTAPALSELQLGFGPGATESVKKKDSCFRVKLGSPPQCSHELEPFVDRLLGQVPRYTHHHATRVEPCTGDQDSNPSHWFVASDLYNYDIVDVDVSVVFGRLEFVPKNAKKYRTITVEPGLNVLMQQGLGKWMRRRLKVAGIDLSDQERNKALARLGSEVGHLATLDLSSASDTISSQLVAFLLPEDWFVLLSLARTRTVTYKGLAIPLEKFSTMGNSFTFELESLIFWALIKASLRYLKLPVTKKTTSVYGDDLIVPVASVSLVTCVLAFCGFTLNLEKSFWAGPFRESCGWDYLKGMDIRPYYQKHLVTPESLFSLHNHYMRSFDFVSAERVRALLHPDLIIFGPDGYGDGHLIGDWTPSSTAKKLSRREMRAWKYPRWVPLAELGWEGCFFESHHHVSPRNLAPHNGDPLLPSFAIYMRGEDREEQLYEKMSTSCSKGDMWADPKYFVVPGSVGYEKISIYTRHRGIFVG